MARIYDVNDAFLKGKFEDGEEIFMEVPQGMEHHFWDSAVLRLLKSIYRLKKAALIFSQRLLEITKNMRQKQTIAEPCMYFSRNKSGKLAIWLSWL